MDRVSVDSKMMVSFGYDAATSTLEIEFTAGSVYAYYEVPSEIFHGLFAAPSKGDFFREAIEGVYRSARV